MSKHWLPPLHTLLRHSLCLSRQELLPCSTAVAKICAFAHCINDRTVTNMQHVKDSLIALFKEAPPLAIKGPNASRRCLQDKNLQTKPPMMP